MGQIKVEKNVGGIEGLCIVEPAVHGDERGYFMETYNERDMKEAGIDIHFVQDNQSMSTKGVLRGLHFQKQYPQCKLVRAMRGTVFDVAVDLRSNLTLPWICVPIPGLMENGSAWFYLRKIKSSSSFRKVLHMDFWC